MIHLFRPSFGAREKQAVAEVLQSGWVGRGARTREFEAAFAAHLRVRRDHVVSVSSCTEGLFHAIAALRLGSGDEVVLPALSFVGAANAVAASGATPVFCDVDRRHLNPRRASIEAAVTPRTRAVIVLHYGGVPLELSEIAELCRRQGLWLIEDAANSVASTEDSRACGTFGDIGVWSFDAMKILVTGEGGMVWCRDPQVLHRIRRHAALGLVSFSAFESEKTRRWWELEVTGFGRRSILPDTAAALGLVQLRRLPAFVRRRRHIHRFYLRALADLDWLALPPEPPPGIRNSHYFFWVQCAGQQRDALAYYLRDHGVYTTFRYHPLHLVPIYGSTARLPKAEAAAESTLLLPQHQGLSRQDLEKVVDLVHGFPHTSTHSSASRPDAPLPRSPT